MAQILLPLATLFVSRAVSYKMAIAEATETTLLGSVISIFLASTLLKNYLESAAVFAVTLLFKATHLARL
jgi:hypothetical protein